MRLMTLRFPNPSVKKLNGQQLIGRLEINGQAQTFLKALAAKLFQVSGQEGDEAHKGGQLCHKCICDYSYLEQMTDPNKQGCSTMIKFGLLVEL